MVGRIASSKSWNVTRLALLASLIGCGGGGSSSGGGGSSPPSGIAYSANSIVYGVPAANGATFGLYQVQPNGTSNIQLLANLPTSILLFSQIPTLTNKFAIAADLTGQNTFGIYISTGLSQSLVTTLVQPIYSYVSSVSVSSDGKNLVYSATLASDPAQASYLFTVPLTGGNPIQLDFSDGSTLSPADNDTIAYVASPGGTANFDQVFTRSLKAGISGKASQITSDSINHTLPTFNRSGTRLAYWESSTTNTLMIQTIGSTALPTSLPNPTQFVPQGAAFNSDGSQIVIAADQNEAGEILTQNTNGSSSPAVILMNAQLVGNYGVYWTNQDGKGRGLLTSMMPTTGRRRSRLAMFLGR